MNTEFNDPMQSAQIDQLMTALSKAQATIKTAAKKKKNPYFKSEYADLPLVWEACRESLTSNGLAITQTIDGQPGNLFLTCTLGHVSGQWIKSRVPLIMAKNDPQTMGSCITYARRYTLSAMVGVCQDDEDDDGEAVTAPIRSGEVEAPPVNAPSVKAAPKWPPYKEKLTPEENNIVVTFIADYIEDNEEKVLASRFIHDYGKLTNHDAAHLAQSFEKHLPDFHKKFKAWQAKLGK